MGMCEVDEGVRVAHACGELGVGGVSAREVVEIALPEMYVGLHSTDGFNMTIAAALYRGAEIKLTPSVDVSVDGQDYLLLVQPCMRHIVLSDLGNSPDVKGLNRYAMSVLSGPTMLRNYSFEMREDGSVRLSYAATSITAWEVLMRIKGVKIGSAEEKRLLRSAVLRPLIEPEGFLSFGDDLVKSSGDQAMRLPEVSPLLVSHQCNCLVSRLVELVGRQSLAGAKNLRDVIASIDFVQAVMFTEVASCELRVAVRRGVLVCVQRDDPGMRRVSVAGLSSLPDDYLDAPLWCDLCGVLSTVHSIDGAGISCGGCGVAAAVYPQVDYTYDDLVSDPAMHFVLKQRVGIGRAAFERDKERFGRLVATTLTGSASSDEAVGYSHGFTSLMTDLGKYAYCLGLQPADHADRAQEAWIHRFDYAYTGVFRARYLHDTLGLVGMSRSSVSAELLCVSYLKRVCGCGYRSDVGMDTMVSALVDGISGGKNVLGTADEQRGKWAGWHAGASTQGFVPEVVVPHFVVEALDYSGGLTAAQVRYAASVHDVGGWNVSHVRVSLRNALALGRRRGNAVGPLKVVHDPDGGVKLHGSLCGANG